MFSTILKWLLAGSSIAAGIAGAIYLATTSPGDVAFALRLPSLQRLDARDASRWQLNTADPLRSPQLPAEPAPFYLPNDHQARAVDSEAAERVELTAYTAQVQDGSPPSRLAQLELPPPPPLDLVPTDDEVEVQAPAVPAELKQDQPVPRDAQENAPTVESHPLPRRNFLAPRNVAPAATVQPPAKMPLDPFANDGLETLPPAPQVQLGEGDDKLYINVQNTDIREVLQLIGAQGGLNILASQNVSGNVSAMLNGVDVRTALTAILRSHGYASRQDGKIIYVGTPADLLAIGQTSDHIATRVYRPNYVTANDMQKLITPMLTQSIGRVTVSTASQVDIPADQVSTGGDSFGGSEVLIVRDYEAVLMTIDELIMEIDIRPTQVSIEAMILSVRLQDEYKMGINFELLRDRANVRLAQGTATADLASLTFTPGSLKLGFLDGSMSGLIEALETVGETNVVASPRLMVLNKQRAEIQIGEQLGYVNTTVTENASTQSVAFLEVGTLLRLRPFIASDGLVRLEVHPELSTGNVTVQSGLTLPNKSVTQVTTNVMCRDGCTVVLGGLIRQDLNNDTKQLPFLGSVPWIGPIFRNKTENQDRVEIIVLLTPRIVGDSVLGEEGARLQHEFSERQGVYFDQMSPLGKRHMGEKHYRLAKAAVAACDYENALKQVNLSIHYNPQSREAVMLREQIVTAGGFEQESAGRYLRQGLAPFTHPHKDYTRKGYPWKSPAEFGFEELPSELPQPSTPTPRKTLKDPTNPR